MPTTTAHRSPWIPLVPRTAGKLRRLALGPCEADLDGKQLRINGALVPLPLIEFELFAVLMDNTGRIMSHDELAHAAWRGARPRPRTVMCHMQHLRARLATYPEVERLLRTVPGLGYVFDEPA